MATSSMPKMKLEHGATVSVVDWPKDLQALYIVARKKLRIRDNSIRVKAGSYHIASEDAFQAYSATVANTQASVVITLETDGFPIKSIQPVAVQSGLCWQDLFIEDGLPPINWPSIAAVVNFAEYGKVTLSSDLRYKIEVTGRKGHIHLVVCDDDEDGLTASEVLQQRPDLYIGGYTIPEHLHDSGWDVVG
ncbi:hypothetical protein BDZ89DRAFT_1045294 [Hymenopellis radicata]|nr:hypothetical protein BDZ89DRAFT_1045294 [Hymenopellis radicata]